VIHVTEESEAQSPASKPAWAIACRDAHLTEVGKPDVWSAMDAIGVEGVEVTVHMDGTCPGLFGREKPFSIADEGGVGDLGDALGSHKKKISAFCLHNRFDEQPDEEVAFVKRVTKVAVKLGVRAIRLDVVPRKLAGKDEEFLRFAIEVGKRIIDATRDTSVRFGVENHGGTTNRPDFLRRLFDGIGSNRFGLTLDTANFYWFGHPLSRLYEIYREFAPAACHTHCKSIRYPESEREKQRERGWEYGKFCCPVYEGDIDFTRVATILREAGYQGDLCIENESLSRFDKGERGAILRREADFLRRIAQNA
jgi:sugar phosphate isomerase/epimerase